MSWALLTLLLAASPPVPAHGIPPLRPFAPAGLTEDAARPMRRALLIGVNTFQDERFTPLSYAEKDARAMGEALREFDEVQVLTGEAQTTRAAILDALRRLSDATRNERDTVVVYLSTHGSLSDAGGRALERFLVASDTRMNVLAETGIAVSDLTAELERMNSRRKVLILAACHGGRGKSVVRAELARALSRQKAPLAPLDESSEALWLFTASAFAEAARESDELGHDIYTWFLLEAFERGDRDGDGAITAEELHDYARERTYHFSGGLQRPTAESRLVGLDPVVLRGRRQRAARPVLFTYARSSEGLLLAIDGVVKGALPGGVAAEPGAHQLELRDARSGSPVFRGAVTLREGERLDVSRLIPEPLRFDLALEAGAWGVLDGRIRGEALPVLGSVGATLGVSNLLWNRSHLELRLTGHLGSGATPGFDETLAFQARALQASLGVGHSLPITSRWTLTPRVQAGALWAWREFRKSDLDLRERLRGTSAGAGFTASFLGLDGVGVGMRVMAGGLLASLGGAPAVHPWAEAGAWVALRR